MSTVSPPSADFGLETVRERTRAASRDRQCCWTNPECGFPPESTHYYQAFACCPNVLERYVAIAARLLWMLSAEFLLQRKTYLSYLDWLFSRDFLVHQKD